MKKIVFITCCLISLLAGQEKVCASHIAGADLTYTCLGGNTYRFNFTLYRDCSGIPVSYFYTLKGISTCGDSVTVTVYLDTTFEVGHTCSTIVTRCTDINSTYRGFEANYYHGDITLPSVCNSWTFGLSPALCNRNPAISTLYPSAVTYCIYVETTLDNSILQCNNSPVFGNLPLQFLCADQVQYYSSNAYDPDGDSLTYKMISPHHTSDSDVIYMAGLSGTQPVIYNMPDSTSIDTATGHVSFNAAGPQVTVMAIQVNEYRNGVLIGSVERDIELIFENCVNNLPTATGIDGTVSHIARVCANDPLSFFINSNDQDSAQLTQLSWDAGIPGATFYTSGTYRDTGYFYWLPDTQYISSLPYTFTLTVIDDACPNFGTNTYLYVVYVDSCNTTSAPVVANFVRDFSATYLQVNQSIRFRYILYTSDEAEVSLYDAVGRKVENTSIEKSTGVEREMTVNGLTNGVYLLTLKTGKGESKTVKVIIN